MFCEYFEIDCLSSSEQIKSFIEKNITKLLESYCSSTFDCPVIYYNRHTDLLLFIKIKENINWTNQDIVFSHIKSNKKWNESSSISICDKNIGEFQIHNHRNCIKFRWSFEKLLNMFKDNFDIIEL